MQIGYNNDVEYRKKTFHIQTEDRGEPAASIETQIFHAGAILDTSIISYDKVLAQTQDIDERIERIRALMQGNHKKLYKKLFAGEYDHMVGLERAVDKTEVLSVPDDFVPSQEAVPAAALEIERGNITSLGDEPEGDVMDLAALQAQLNADAEAAEAATQPPPAAVAPPTMMIKGRHDTAATQQTPVAPRRIGVAPQSFDYPATGAKAWRGCGPIKADADIIKLVEEFAG